MDRVSRDEQHDIGSRIASICHSQLGLLIWSRFVAWMPELSLPLVIFDLLEFALDDSIDPHRLIVKIAESAE